MSVLLVDVGAVPATTSGLATAIPTSTVEAGSGEGVVSVYVTGFGNTTAGCSCGWAGRRRLLRAAAQQDAWTHSMQNHCQVSAPLVFAW